MSSYVNGYLDGFDEGNSIKNRESSSCFLDGQSPVGGKVWQTGKELKESGTKEQYFFIWSLLKYIHRNLHPRVECNAVKRSLSI